MELEPEQQRTALLAMGGILMPLAPMAAGIQLMIALQWNDQIA